MRTIPVLLSCTSTLLGLAAQVPRLLTDVNATVQSAQSTPQAFAQVGAFTFFTARTSADGRELWRTDGSAAGTLRLTDLAPGPGEVPIAELRSTGSRLLFAVGDPLLDQELWSSDGTVAGTRGLLRFGGPIVIAPGARSGSNLVFVRDELWLSDGTAGGTRFVRTLGDFRHEVLDVEVLGNLWLFVRNEHVWRTDGTGAGTRILGRSPNPHSGVVVAGAHAYWGGEGGVRRSDGTSNDLVVPSAAFIEALDALGGKIVYVPGNELWTLDVATLHASLVTSPFSPGGQFTRVGSQLFLPAYDPTTGRELWVTDGTAAGTRLVHDLVPGPESPSHDGLFALGNQLLHAVSTPTIVDLWSVSAGAMPPRLLRSFPSGRIDALAVAQPGARAFFAADDGVTGSEVWTTDGTAGGTRLAFDLAVGAATASSSPYRFFGGAVATYFDADDGVHGRELWVTDGSAARTRMVADVEPGVRSANPNIIGWHAGLVYFVAGPIPRAHLWVSDGTAAGTRLLLPLPGGIGAQGRLQPLDSRRAILQLLPHLSVPGVWVTDGRTTTHLGESSPLDVVRVGQRVFFPGLVSAGQSELAVTDGTPAGTRTVINLNGSTDSRANPLAALGEEVIFSAWHNALPGLYASDGTTSGTRLVLDLTGRDIAFHRALTVADQVFLVGQSSSGNELWVSDGTAAGTRELTALEGRATPSLVEVEGRVVVGTDRSLWRSDGTVAGTVRLRSSEALLGEGVSDGRYAYWLSRSPTGILRTDGTSAGTTLLPAGPGEASVALANGRLIFTSDDGRQGAEPWVLDVGAAASSIGLGCGPRTLLPTLRGTAPVLGSVARLQGDSLPSAGIGLALLRLTVPSAQPVQVPGIGCLAWGDANGPSVQWTITFNNGRFADLLAIPQATHLIGARVVVDSFVASVASLEMTNAVHWTLGR